MGVTRFHKNLFFKFQSITTSKIRIALLAFPSTPWAFVFRQPVQTMMSHLDPRKGGEGPCLRSMSMRETPKEVVAALSQFGQTNLKSNPREAWCAAHLNMLCQYALDAYNEFKHFAGEAAKTKITSEGEVVQRGMLIDYESLPGMAGVIAGVIAKIYFVTNSSLYRSTHASQHKVLL